MRSLSILSALIIVASAVPDIYYVLPDEGDYLDCPINNCDYLGHYVLESNSYFTRGSIFIFMPGNHTLDHELELNGVSNVILEGKRTVPNTNTICRLNHNIFFTNTRDITVRRLTFLLHSYEHDRDSALFVDSSYNVEISNMRFLGSGDLEEPLTRAVYSYSSNITITNSSFIENTGNTGGAIRATEQSHLIVVGSTFLENRAAESGGAITVDYYLTAPSSITIENSTFIGNSAERDNGGAINCDICSLLLQGRNNFSHNYCKNVRPGNSFSDGGALYVVLGIFTLEGEAYFSHNRAQEGGAVYVVASTLQIYSADPLMFVNNSEGALAILRSRASIQGRVVFDANQGRIRGALYIVVSSVRFTGRPTTFSNNTGRTGGAVLILEESSLSFTGRTVFTHNTASTGGAIYSANSRLTFHIQVRFSENEADDSGGGLYASESNITLEVAGTLQVEGNSARNGGGLYLRGRSLLNLEYRSNLIVANNTAIDYGGGIYHEDSPTLTQCTTSEAVIDTGIQEILPYCFLRYDYAPTLKYFIANDSLQNTAGRDGNSLYGGLLDKCRLLASGDVFYPVYTFLVQRSDLLQGNSSIVSSGSYKLCFCVNNTDFDCNGEESRVVHRGQRTNVSLIALAQGNVVISTFVRAVPSNTAKLDLQQNFQLIPRQCSTVTYTIYSTRSSEQLLLYSDGPCQDTGLARAVVQVTVLPCPDAFLQLNEECVCENRLIGIASCYIDDVPSISKRNGSMLWLNGTYNDSGSYQGLILYNSCPREYCKEAPVNITLDDPDEQCAPNHSGLLCGACSANYSLLLGSAHCGKCSNAYLALLLLFLLAGIALTGFLIFFRLTVATGMINSIILYANIVQVNRSSFFPENATNVLTVFIAWMNLDFGFEMCFFDGMDQYSQTWLQFVFPSYVWLLITVIILASRYSILVSKLIGSNPIAVLATLLLMSYMKILKIIVEVYSSVNLEYPNDEIVTVWLKDANVPYLQSKHLVLTLFTSLFLILFFLPYTLLLLTGHQLYRFSGKKHFRWFRQLLPLLESYYAPYRTKTRYWTGFLLLVRCALYIVFSYNSLGGERNSLLVIIITFTAVTLTAWLSIRIYKMLIVNLIEASVYLNLVVLSSTALADSNTPALVYSLVGVVFVTTVAIIGYHFHMQYIAKAEFWTKIKAKVNLYYKQKQTKKETVEAPSGISSRDHTKIVTQTHIDLREPVLEN